MNPPTYEALVLFFGLTVVAIVFGVVWPVVATASSMIGTFAAEAAFAVVYLQSQELFPTSVRGARPP